LLAAPAFGLGNDGTGGIGLGNSRAHASIMVSTAAFHGCALFSAAASISRVDLIVCRAAWGYYPAKSEV
jgi:hypothetical protein